MSLEASKYDIRKREEESMTPPTESELDKLQSRIDMRKAAEDALRSCKFGNCITTWAHASVELMAKHVLTLLDEIEELETTIATQACDIVEYKRERALTRSK